MHADVTKRHCGVQIAESLFVFFTFNVHVEVILIL